MENLTNFIQTIKTKESEFPNDYDLGSELRKVIRDIDSIESIVEVYESNLSQSRDNYLRLLAEFDNYKKRVFKERESLQNDIKLKLLSSILDLDSDLYLASANEQSHGLKLIMSKFAKFLEDQGINPIQTETYDADLHEVISITPSEDEKIVAVISRGYTIDGKPVRYPKVILGRPNE